MGGTSFRWQQVNHGQWILAPSIIGIREDAPGRWNVYVGERQLYPLNYTAPEVAKREAWDYARRHRREYFGVYWKRSMRLEA